MTDNGWYAIKTKPNQQNHTHTRTHTYTHLIKERFWKYLLPFLRIYLIFTEVFIFLGIQFLNISFENFKNGTQYGNTGIK